MVSLLSTLKSNQFLGVSGDILAAMDNFEAFYKLSTDQPWELSSGQSMFTAACDHLSRVYSAMAEIQEKDEKPVQQLEFLRKAYEMALEGELTSNFSLSLRYYVKFQSSNFIR